jgi:hypothetical protein
MPSLAWELVRWVGQGIRSEMSGRGLPAHRGTGSDQKMLRKGVTGIVTSSAMSWGMCTRPHMRPL